MKFLLLEKSARKNVALLRLNRPKELNALNLELMQEIRQSLQDLDQDDDVRVIVITGNERAFAAGADIKQMAGKKSSGYAENRPILNLGPDPKDQETHHCRGFRFCSWRRM